jgi:hypothetical protein
MSRRQFLGFLGAAALSVVGVSAVLKGLQSMTNGQPGSHSGTSYGGGAYGGTADSASRKS